MNQTPETTETVDTTLWGKNHGLDEPYPLLCHLLDTAAAAQVVWDSWLRPGLRQQLTRALAPGKPSVARAKIAAIAGLHDIGKANKIFQGQMLSPNNATRRDFAELRKQLSSTGYDMKAPTGVHGLPLAEADRRLASRHEAASMNMMMMNQWPEPSDQVHQSWVGAIVGGHHGKYYPCGERWQNRTEQSRTILNSLSDGRWGLQQDAIIRLVLESLNLSLDQLNAPLNEEGSTAIILITGIVTLADWLASTDESIAHGQACKVDPVTQPGNWVRNRRAKFFKAELTRTLGTYTDIDNPVKDIMGKHAATMSPLQSAASTVRRGLWIATETTGGGKTEAALLRHAAVPGESLLFALPTRATTDAMWERIRHYYRHTRNAGRLLHAYSKLNRFYTGGSISINDGLHSQDWLNGTGRALLAPITVGTCDQVLLGALRQSRSYLRLLALANHHVVLDEVHSYDRYQSVLLEELLAWWGKTDTRVTMLSASLPDAQQRRYMEAYAGSADRVADVHAHYPGHTTVTKTTATSRTFISRRSYDLDIHTKYVPAGLLADAYVQKALHYRTEHPDARIAIVVNQVDHAILVADKLTKYGYRTTVLHSRMSAGHRSEVTDKLHRYAGKDSNETGGFVIGTQTIESSLDLDFDFMISGVAPAASLIQRAGRLWRASNVTDGVWEHPRARYTPKPLLDVLVPVSDANKLHKGSLMPYLLGEISRTLTALRKHNGTISLPGDVQDLVNAADFDTDDYSVDTDAGDESEELIKVTQRLAHAKKVTIPIRETHGPRSVLRDTVTFEQLSEMTEPEEQDELSTRFADYETVNCILMDDNGRIEYAWRGSPTLAGSTRTTDSERVKMLLGAAFPIAVNKLHGYGIEPIFGQYTDVGRTEWAPQAAILRNLVPVRISDPDLARYDPVIGLQLPNPQLGL